MPSKHGPSNRGKLIRVAEDLFDVITKLSTRDKRPRAEIVRRAIALYCNPPIFLNASQSKAALPEDVITRQSLTRTERQSKAAAKAIERTAPAKPPSFWESRSKK